MEARSTDRNGVGSLRNALLCRLRRLSATSRRKTPAFEHRVKCPAAGARRVVVKAHVQRMGPGAAKAAARHLRYVERYGVERHGSKAVLYTADCLARTEALEES